jgi:hypothetical protein
MESKGLILHPMMLVMVLVMATNENEKNLVFSSCVG